MKSLRVTIVVWFLLTALVRADTTFVVGGLNGLDPYADPPTCRAALALSGGGARGLAGIGILQAFEEENIEPVAIAGTSMGGVIGGLYACGYSADELRDIVQQVDISAMVSSRAPRSSLFLEQRQERDRYLLTVRFDGYRPEIPRGLTGGQEITSLLTRLTARAQYLAGGDFTKFPIPFKTVGTDIVSGRLVIMERGSLADAMRATMAFPLAFTGLERGDSLLMDGGMLMPVPVEVVRNMVAPSTPVVAVNTTSPLVDEAGLVTPVDIANQVTTIMTADERERQLAMADIVTAPVGKGLSSTDFKYADSIIALGYRAGLEIADSIRLIHLSDTDTTTYHVNELVITGVDRATENALRRIGLERPFTLAQLQQDLKTLIRTGPFFEIAADVRRVDSVSNDSALVNLTLEVRPAPLLEELTFHFDGNTVYDDLTLAEQLVFDGDRLAPTDLNESVDRLIAFYARDGYDVVGVEVTRVDLAAREIHFAIDEATVKRIDVTNNRRTRDWLIRSYIPVERYEPFSLEAASRGLADLYGTELFERVTFDLKPNDSGAIFDIRVKERKYSQVRLGWHWHDEYESEEFIELLDDNVNGMGLEFLTHAQYGPDRQHYHTGLRLDRIFFTYLSARLRLFYHQLDRNLFHLDGTVAGYREEERWGMEFYIGQQIERLGQVRLGLIVEEVAIENHITNTNAQIGLRTIHFESETETFDRYPFPNSGARHQFEVRFAGELLGGQSEFSRFRTSVEAYYPFGQYFTYHPRVLIGLSRRGLPVSERFYIGGQHSLAGFRTNELSGDKVFLINQEFRLNGPYQTYLIGRLDLGDVYASADDIKPGKFKHGLGLAFAVNTLLGPFEIGYGTGFSKKDRVYFSAGFEF